MCTFPDCTARPLVLIPFYQLDLGNKRGGVYRHLSRGRCDHKYYCQFREVLIKKKNLPFFLFLFSPQGKYPGKGGMIAPGMACQYAVQFIPEYLGEYEDHILVESQGSEPFVIPVQAKVSLPVLTCQ